jgi:hypothetical protein
MKHVGIAMVVVAGMALPLHGGTYSGTLKTKQGRFLADMILQATREGTGEVVSFVVTRTGTFSAELSDGTWAITADSAALAKLGLAPFPGASVTMSGGGNQSANLVLHATEPLWTPTMEFSRSTTGTLTFKIKGQAGTRVTIYSSTDLNTWSTFDSITVASTLGHTLTFGNPPGNYTKRYFKAVATTDL